MSRKLWRLGLAGAVLFSIVSLQLALAGADSGSTADWSSPGAVSLKKVGAVNVLAQAAYQFNLDCTPASFLPVDGTTPRQGCFMNAPFGGYDVSGGFTAFYNASGHAVPLIPYSPHDTLLPWPGTLDMLALSPAPGNGSYLSLYGNITASLRDEYSGGDLVAKVVTRPPDKALYDQNGKLLIVNFNTLSFSSNGAWLVAETWSGTFVRINLATLDVTAFAPAFVGGLTNPPAVNETQTAVSNDGRYVALANSTLSSFKVYDLSACASSQYTGDSPLSCRAHEYWPFIKSQASGLHLVEQVRFENDSLASFLAASDNGFNSYVLAPSAGIGPLTDYLALGDSYTSGEGVRDYLPGTDTGLNTCRLSAGSYPLLIVHDLFTAAGGHSVACSGAKSQDILPSQPLAYHGQAQGKITGGTNAVLATFTPGYVPQADFVSRYQPRILSVSIGGNDIGFGTILATCVEPHLGLPLADANTCYNTYEKRLELAQTIDREANNLTSLFKRLRDKSPLSKLYVIGYPQIAVPNGDCALNVHLNADEITLSTQIIHHLNAAITYAAGQAGATYVNISHALDGHRLCETKSAQVAVNGLTEGTASGVGFSVGGKHVGINFLARESYHPNALGHRLIEQAILKQTQHFADAEGQSIPVPDYQPAANDLDGLLNAPKSGAPVSTVVPDDTISDGIVTRGAELSITADGLADGLRPNTSYSIKLDGPSGNSIGTIITAADGTLTGKVQMPGNAPSGPQSLNVTGEDEAGNPIDVTKVIYVPTSDLDFDGDGIPNTDDSCFTIPNSGIDADQDGIDDTCDPLIGALAQPGQNDGSPTQSGSTTTPLAPTSGGDSPGGGGPSTPISTGVILDTTAEAHALQTASLPLRTSQQHASAAAVLGAATVNPNTAGHLVKARAMVTAYKNASPMVVRWLPWARAGGFVLIAAFLGHILALLVYRAWTGARAEPP